jgi:hypothetical protein
MPKVGVAAEPVGERLAKEEAGEPNLFMTEGGLKHFFVHRPDGNLDVVQRVDPDANGTFTTITFSPLNGSGLLLTVDGRTREVSLLTARGLVTLKPAGQHAWRLCASRATGPAAVPVASAFECYVIDEQGGGPLPKEVLTGAIDVRALSGFSSFAERQGLVELATVRAQELASWDCVGAILAGVSAGLGMAFACGATPFNISGCIGGVSGYLSALIFIAQICS